MTSRFGIDPEKLTIPLPDEALPGRAERMTIATSHYVNHASLEPPFPDGTEEIIFGMGCFWGAERAFWAVQGVYMTAVGYSGGLTPNPTYQEVCSGRTGHNEVVLVVFYPSMLPFDRLLNIFWEGHDPTQGMRQGNDIGTQYRSGIYCSTEEQKLTAEASLKAYQTELSQAGFNQVSTEIKRAGDFYYAEEYHQQYLAKEPGGYCGLGGTGVPCR